MFHCNRRKTYLEPYVEPRRFKIATTGTFKQLVIQKNIVISLLSSITSVIKSLPYSTTKKLAKLFGSFRSTNKVHYRDYYVNIFFIFLKI